MDKQLHAQLSVWEEITYPIPNSNGVTLLDMRLLSPAGIKVKLC